MAVIGRRFGLFSGIPKKSGPNSPVKYLIIKTSLFQVEEKTGIFKMDLS
jgi:hypothetical protein